MIKFTLSKILRFLYRLLSKIIYLCVPIFSRILIFTKLHSRVINQLNKIRSESHKLDNHSSLILEILNNNKIISLDVGAQGGFFKNSMFPKIYDKFFTPILVEPIAHEAKKLINEDYKVIQKGLWSSNCTKKLYILGNRTGSSSMYKPNKNFFDLYNIKKKDFHLFEVSEEIDIECSTLKESLNKLDVKKLDFLKIDTQGAELEILKGIGAYFPLLLKLEVQVVPMYLGVPSWTELTSYLNKLNYMTCEWTGIGSHLTRSPVEMDMMYIPNYKTEEGKKLILSRQKEFISLMIIFGHIKLLQTISEQLNLSSNSKIEKLKDKYFQ